MPGVLISLPDPGHVDDDPTFPRWSGGYVTVENLYDFPVQLTIHSTPEPNILYLPPQGGQVPLSGKKLYRVEIEALPRPTTRPGAASTDAPEAGSSSPEPERG